MNHPPLKSLYTFVAVAQTGSMTSAAELLHVSHSAVSQSIKTLENQLNTPLFSRVGRNVELNAVGKKYLKRVQPALEEIVLASEEVAKQSERNRLSLNMVNSLVLHWWIPRVADFQAQVPLLDIRVSNITGVFDLQKEHVDVALIHGSAEDWSNYYCEKLGDDELVLVISPDLLNEDNTVESVLNKYPAIFAENPRRELDWPTWCKAYEYPLPLKTKNLMFSASIQAVQACIRKLGVFVTHKEFVIDDINHGLLTIVGEPIANPKMGYYFVCKEEQLIREEIVTLRHWLKTQFN